MRWRVTLAIAGLITAADLSRTALAEDLPAGAFHTGKALARVLEQPVSVTWEHSSPRAVARRIEQTRRVAFLLDRRLDPSREFSLSVASEPLAFCLERLALAADVGAQAQPEKGEVRPDAKQAPDDRPRPGGGRLSIMQSVCYLGPLPAANRLRTLVALRENELNDPSAEVPRTVRASLLRRRRIEWKDLDRPRDLLARVCALFELDSTGLDQIPHDLWAAAVLPEVTAAEALTLLLIQYDLTFRWAERGRALVVEQISEPVAIERRHLPPPGLTAESALARWRHELGVDGRVESGRVIVRARLEEHEAIALPRSTVASRGPDRKPPAGVERFSLRIRETPLRSLLRELGTPQHGALEFEFDEGQLHDAGIDLNTRVSFEVSNVSIDELLDKALGPLGLAFELDGRTVRLSPADR